MTSPLVNSIQNLSKTANGALSRKTSGSSLLDFFAQAGAIRTKSTEEILGYFNSAFKENPLYALKALFYFRDVREGQGERKMFRTVIQKLSTDLPQIVEKLIPLIPEFGRWDDLLIFEGTPVQDEAFQFFADAILKDFSNLDNAKENVSLAAKWAPSENASSTVTRLLAQSLRKYTGLNSRDYRKTLSALRERIGIVEAKMCSKDWPSINYEHVPSRANLIYRKAFKKHDGDRYISFHTKVAKGEAKVNAATLYPYDVIRPIFPGTMSHNGVDKYFVNTNTNVDVLTLNNLWNALPNYMGENTHNGLVVVDTSGSMRGMPIQVATSLGIYFAERNVGPFKDYFITFSASPKLQKVEGDNIVQKVANLVKTDWDANTNLTAVFDLVLNRALQDGISQEDMPANIYIVSDMQFDKACPDNQKTNFEVIRAKYQESGYQMPNLVFWNVNALGGDSPVKKDDKGTVLVSGCSPSILKKLLGTKEKNPYDVMMEVLDSERYSKIVI